MGLDNMNYMDHVTFLREARPTTIQKDVQRQIYVGRLKGVYSREHIINVFGIPARELDSVKAIEPEGRREREDWSFLAGKIVGAEIPSN